MCGDHTCHPKKVWKESEKERLVWLQVTLPIDLPPLQPGKCPHLNKFGGRCKYNEETCPFHGPSKKKRKKKKKKKPAAPAAAPAGSAAAAQEIECVCRRAPSDFERKAAFALFGWGDDAADDTVTLGNTRKLKKLIERVVDNCGVYLGVARGKMCKFVLQEEEDQPEEEGGGAAAAGEPEEEEEGEGKVIKYSQAQRDRINAMIASGWGHECAQEDRRHQAQPCLYHDEQ